MQSDHELWRCLNSIPGIGRKSAFKICHGVGLLPKTPFKLLTERQSQALETFIESRPTLGHWKLSVVGPEYRRMMKEKREKMINTGSIQGIRLSKGLPINGQTTKNNAVTARKLAKRGRL